jgi:hypothetical protein
MPLETFPSYPPCCQKCLAALLVEGKMGSRNCEKGHCVNLTAARQVESKTKAAKAGHAT